MNSPISPKLLCDMPRLVKLALQHGWIKFQAGSAKKADNADYKRRWRQARYERGLTATGKPRRNKTHPELRGLSRRDYNLRYMQLWRKGLL